MAKTDNSIYNLFTRAGTSSAQRTPAPADSGKNQHQKKPRKNKSVPEIRFPGFTEPWVERKLGEIYQSIGNAFVGTATPYYVENGHFYLESNNVKDGQINRNTEIFINDEFYEKQKDKWLHTGDMVMVQSGHVGHAAVIPAELDNSAAHALIMFRNPKIKIQPYFLNYQYQTIKAKNKIKNITVGNTISHILASDMREFIVDIPSFAEQQKIGAYFQNLDNLIIASQRELEGYQKLKQGMLQKMFPKEGKRVPEIRFPKFTGPWVERKLEEVANVYDGVHQTPEYKDSGIMFLSVEDIATLQSEKYISEEAFRRDYKVYPQQGDILMTRIGDIGTPNVVETTEPIAFYVSLALIKPFKIDSYFLSNSIQSPSSQKELKDRSLVTATPQKINKSEIGKINIFVPPTVTEQQKIAAYFQNLDNLISASQREVEGYKKLKSAMLEKMFV